MPPCSSAKGSPGRCRCKCPMSEQIGAFTAPLGSRPLEPRRALVCIGRPALLVHRPLPGNGTMARVYGTVGSVGLVCPGVLSPFRSGDGSIPLFPPSRPPFLTVLVGREDRDGDEGEERSEKKRVPDLVARDCRGRKRRRETQELTMTGAVEDGKPARPPSSPPQKPFARHCPDSRGARLWWGPARQGEVGVHRWKTLVDRGQVSGNCGRLRARSSRPHLFQQQFPVLFWFRGSEVPSESRVKPWKTR